MASIRIYSSILIVMSLLSLGSSETGVGTINDPPYLPSACYGYQDHGVMIAAVNQDLWQGGATCGKNFQVTCTGALNQGVPHPCTSTPTVTVMITDFCPPLLVARGTLTCHTKPFLPLRIRELEESKSHTNRCEDEE